MENLLILGAGGHGFVCKEVAEAMGIFDRVGFLDDNAPHAIGKLKEYKQFSDKFKYAFVGIGNNKLRSDLLDKLSEAGFKIPALIHPRAYVSPTAEIKCGSVVEPMAVVNAKVEIREGCIISVGSIVDHDAVIDRCAHVNAGAICKGGSKVDSLVKLEAGQVVLGY